MFFKSTSHVLNILGFLTWPLLILVVCTYLIYAPVESASDFKCATGQFQCENERCISFTWRCDNDNDCGDSSDEKNCSSTTCDSFGKFRCDNGACIRMDWKCDRERDCDDGSDERDCGFENVTCPVTKFRCKSQAKCVPLHWRCDLDNDCGDKSDELGCEKPTCSTDDFMCDNGRCIQGRWQCDEENDCGDGSDEDPGKCPQASCRPGYFTCNNRKCIRQNWVCDGDNDCQDNSDESPPVCKISPKRVCERDEFQCKSGTNGAIGKCIIGRWQCDGQRDCHDGSDEDNCPSTIICRTDQFTCKSGMCLLKQQRCNGVTECPDGDDEEHCLRECTDEQFRCGTLPQCIPNSLVCDGSYDCFNGFDEPSSCNVNECANHNGHCAHYCNDTKTGYVCSCKHGYELDTDGISCKDVNECTRAGMCSQLCENTKGGYKCACVPGYELQANRWHCKALGPTPFLVFSDRRAIRKLNVDSTQYHEVVKDLHSVVGICYFAMAGFIYWSDTQEKQISRASIDLPEKQEIIVQDIRDPDGLAVDWLGQNLYWVDTTRHVIEVATLAGAHRSKLITVGLDQPRGVAVDPTEGERFLYWSDWGEVAKIERISMDGDPSTRLLLRSQNYSWPNGLTIDFTIGQLYWVDAKRKTVETCNLNGTNHQILVTVIGQHPFSVTVFEDYLYWTDWTNNQVHQANKFTGREQAIVQSGLYMPMGITVYHAIRQPGASNPCSEGKCSHLCLLSHTKGHQCACPTGLVLLHDGHTCNTTTAYYCTSWFCQNGGECYNTTDDGEPILPKCRCIRGYRGSRCEDIVNILAPEVTENGTIIKFRCSDDYCLNGGVCIESIDENGVPEPHCSCSHGFYGHRCHYFYPNFHKPPDTDDLSDDGSSDMSEDEKYETIGIAVGVVLAIVIGAFVIGYLMYKHLQRQYSKVQKVVNFDNPIYKRTTTEESTPIIENEEEENPEDEGMMSHL